MRFLAPDFPQPPDDLKGRVGLSCASSHDEQDAVFTASDCIHRAIDGDKLIVARRFTGTVVVIVLRGHSFLRRACTLWPLGSAPTVRQARETGREEISRSTVPAGAGAVVFEESITVRAISKRHVENLSVFECLLHAGADRVVIVLCFHDRDGNVRLVEEDVVGFLGFAAFHRFAANDNAAFGKVDFLAKLGHHVPLGSVHANDRWRDELRADIRFGESFLIHSLHKFQ